MKKFVIHDDDEVPTYKYFIYQIVPFLRPPCTRWLKVRTIRTSWSTNRWTVVQVVQEQSPRQAYCPLQSPPDLVSCAGPAPSPFPPFFLIMPELNVWMRHWSVRKPLRMDNARKKKMRRTLRKMSRWIWIVDVCVFTHWELVDL